MFLVSPFSTIAGRRGNAAAPTNSGYELRNRGAAVLSVEALDILDIRSMLVKRYYCAMLIYLYNNFRWFVIELEIRFGCVGLPTD
jgi:hypothetical protein